MKSMAESHEFRVLFAEHDRAAANLPAESVRSDPEEFDRAGLLNGEGVD